MKNARILILIMVLWVLGGCGDKKQQNDVSLVKTMNVESSWVKKYLDEKIYLDVDVSQLVEKILKSVPDKDELCKMKAALHRFYSHVSVVEGKYASSLKNAKEINISNNLFSILLKDLEEGNAWIEECKERGEECFVGEVDEAYLNNLLH